MAPIFRELIQPFLLSLQFLSQVDSVEESGGGLHRVHGRTARVQQKDKDESRFTAGNDKGKPA